MTKHDLAVLRQRIAVLEAWIDGDCFCPCCEEMKECLEDCTFAQDDPPAADRMREARGVMYGETKA